ncbi:GIY-YIG nuclease family protein [Aequorivita capsosiphonis]|uniref:GIY-YIG nuclease family protein n=1 Tax=Aequorivita capsosiphonis TaxID=487317 RepID=UPI00047E6A60|nr:GIY-YIG nuclease family protein [Aequorivita capsosiphonis]
MDYCVYILHSDKLSRFYTGYSSDFDIRSVFHENSESRKFTYNAADWVLFLKIDCQSQKQAIGIENHIKRMKSSVYIRNLKKYSEMVEKLLDKYK